MSSENSPSMANARSESLCICKHCPSYFDCGEPLSFCLYPTGVSTCITIKNGCTCPGCPVYQELDFTLDYYCIAGSEKAQIG